MGPRSGTSGRRWPPAHHRGVGNAAAQQPTRLYEPDPRKPRCAAAEHARPSRAICARVEEGVAAVGIVQATPAGKAAMDEGLVSVDKFSGGSRVYFLTHLHQDHTGGLGAAGGWRHGPLYCSPVTARLLPTRFPGIDTSLLCPISPGDSVSLSLYSPISGRTISLQVTAIPALHCPGSLMYLFRGDLGCKLYTGDFRWELGCQKARSAKKALLDALAGDTVDVLYMDNTYCHPSLNFPPRCVVAEQMVDFIRAHPDHEVIIGVATLGKEELLLHISRALQTKIWVWPQRLLTIHLLGIDVNEEIFTTQTSLTRVRAVPRYSLTIENLEALNTVCPTIGIMATGIPWLWRIGEGKAKSTGKPPAKSMGYKGQGPGYDPLSPPKVFEKDCYALPYSDHACFPELEDFMQAVRPSAVVGIVSKSSCYLDPRHHLGHLCGDEACADNSTPAKSSGHTGSLTPKRRPSGVKIPRRRRVQIPSSTLYRSRVIMKRKDSRGARIVEPEEPASFA